MQLLSRNVINPHTRTARSVEHLYVSESVGSRDQPNSNCTVGSGRVQTTVFQCEAAGGNQIGGVELPDERRVISKSFNCDLLLVGLLAIRGGAETRAESDFVSDLEASS
jgi:hypothetical protein